MGKYKLLADHIVSKKDRKILRKDTVVNVIGITDNIASCDYGSTKRTNIPLNILKKI